MSGILDSFGRSIDYLRISITDRCNLRCIYCMPPEGVPQMPHNEILSYEEVQSVVRAAAELGVNRIRLTGGEPLVKADKFRYITRLGDLKGVLEGIEAAREAGFHPVKINTVVMRGINDDEILD